MFDRGCSRVTKRHRCSLARSYHNTDARYRSDKSKSCNRWLKAVEQRSSLTKCFHLLSTSFVSGVSVAMNVGEKCNASKTVKEAFVRVYWVMRVTRVEATWSEQWTIRADLCIFQRRNIVFQQIIHHKLSKKIGLCELDRLTGETVYGDLCRTC